MAEPVFNFPHGLKNNKIYKKESLRIKYLYTESYGVAEKDIHDKSDIDQLNNLVTTAYIPYLEYCCHGNHPLVKTLGNSNIKIAHGGIQQDMDVINTTLNQKYTEFITTLPKAPLIRSVLEAIKLMGPSFYTDDFDVNDPFQVKAAKIQTYVNLADTPSPEAVSKITGHDTEYNGPIWTRFWQLDNNLDTKQLIGICGHQPLGKLPMVYQNNLCCDTTYANVDPISRTPMSIKAELNSTGCWSVEITLDKPVTAKFGPEDLHITSYCIHENNMTPAETPQDVEDGKKLYQHFVGETMINNTTYSIWRTAKSADPDNNGNFWRISPVYILKIQPELILSGIHEVQDVDKEVFHIITDIEGNLDFFKKSLELSEHIGGKLVLLGDTWDRGTVNQELEIFRIIEELKPICVVGNRDANKARWILELYNDFDWE